MDEAAIARLSPADREAVQEWLVRRHNQLRTYRRPERRRRWVRQLLASETERARYAAQLPENVRIATRGAHSKKWPRRA